MNWMIRLRASKTSFDLRVHDEVEVALAVADLHVGQAVPFFRQGPKALGEQAKPLDLEGELPRAGLEDPAGEVDDIAHVEALEKGEGRLAHLVLADEGLDAPLAVLDGDEGPLAEIPDRHDPPRDGEPLRHLLQGLVVHLPVGVKNLPGEVGHLRVVGVGLDARGGEGLDFFPSHLEKFTVFHRLSPEVLIRNRFFAPGMREQSEFHYIFFADVSRMFSAGHPPGRVRRRRLTGPTWRVRGRKTLTKQASSNNIPLLYA